MGLGYEPHGTTSKYALFPVKARRPPADVLAIGALTLVSLATNVLPRDLCSFVLIALALAVLPYSRIKRDFWLTVWPLCVILVLGIPGIAEHELRNITRDFFFALTPIALLLIGFWLAERKQFWDQLPLTLVGLGVLFAVQHLSAFALSPSLLMAESMVVRATAGSAADITVLAFLVLLFIGRFTPENTPLRGAAYGTAFAILLISVLLSYSRTAVMLLLLGSLAAKGWLTGRNLKWPLLALGVGLAILLAVPGDEAFGQDATFMLKLTRSLDELAVSNYETYKDISFNWRGFESYKTLEQYLSGNTLQLVIGQGYGALVDLGFYMALGGDASIEFRYIPVLHNGYGYVLLKYGIAGVLLYLTFYSKLIRIVLTHQKSTSHQTAFCARFLFGLTLSLSFVMFVAGGMAELASSEYVVLVGVMASRIFSESRRTHTTRHGSRPHSESQLQPVNARPDGETQQGGVP